MLPASVHKLSVMALASSLLAPGALGCGGGEPPGQRMLDAEPATQAAPAASHERAPSAAPAASHEPAPSAAPAASHEPAPSAAAAASHEPAPSAAPSLRAEDAAQPQSEQRPVPSDALTQARARALFDALVAGEPERGLDFFFPLDAYKQVKDVGNPERDWNVRLIGAYKRDALEISGARKSALGRGEFVELYVPEQAMRWVKPGEEYNKIGYYRVFGSELRYKDGERVRSIPIKSLIAWRGQLYVVHLSSFK